MTVKFTTVTTPKMNAEAVEAMPTWQAVKASQTPGELLVALHRHIEAHGKGVDKRSQELMAERGTAKTPLRFARAVPTPNGIVERSLYTLWKEACVGFGMVEIAPTMRPMAVEAAFDELFYTTLDTLAEQGYRVETPRYAGKNGKRGGVVQLFCGPEVPQFERSGGSRTVTQMLTEASSIFSR